MQAAKFDELIHPSTRLSIVALLAAADWVEFAFIRDHLGLSDSALSKQLSTLEEAGYVHIERPVSDSRRRVHARLTRPAARRSRAMWLRCARSSARAMPRARPASGA